DLGTLGGYDVTPTALKNGWVVGWATTFYGPWHNFAYDLGSTHQTMIDLGFDNDYAVIGVTDGWAVGVSFNPGNDVGQLIAHSLCTDQMGTSALATVDYTNSVMGPSVPLIVSGKWVIGGPTMSRGGTYSENDAWAYRLRVALNRCAP
ncbi:MAG TPA: hypothetical protein VMU14_24980, partial [Acidimicrobiales bacterium]|nr:hypothetical protein [Acidimicrobiales bacterium]